MATTVELYQQALDQITAEIRSLREDALMRVVGNPNATNVGAADALDKVDECITNVTYQLDQLLDARSPDDLYHEAALSYDSALDRLAEEHF